MKNFWELYTKVGKTRLLAANIFLCLEVCILIKNKQNN